MEMRNVFKKIKYFLSTLIVLSSFCFVSFSANKNFYDEEVRTYKSFGEAFDLSYQNFLAALGNEDLQDVNTCWIRLREYNDKLIIGGSAVVWCGYTMVDALDYYGYDIVGFGGMTDDKIKEWIPKIKKKYKKIILFEGVNTVNLAIGSGMTELTQEMIESVATTIVALQNELLEPGGKFVYVKVKEMTYIQDNPDEKTVKNFNKVANELNLALSTMNVPMYEIKYPTTKEYSSGFVHYNSKIVWEDMLSAT